MGSSRLLARPAALSPIRPCCVCLGFADGLAACRTELCRHPAARPEYALHQCRDIHIRVQLRPVRPQTGRRDLYVGQIVGRGIGQPLDQSTVPRRANIGRPVRRCYGLKWVPRAL